MFRRRAARLAIALFDRAAQHRITIGTGILNVSFDVRNSMEDRRVVIQTRQRGVSGSLIP